MTHFQLPREVPGGKGGGWWQERAVRHTGTLCPAHGRRGALQACPLCGVSLSSNLELISDVNVSLLHVISAGGRGAVSRRGRGRTLGSADGWVPLLR